ncbi:hypothetical protein, partial [Dialister invisus]|uniref:hypothetical protein n=1 Tax=Dialister invisus TaxID=218538 RepID=UPI003AB323C0
SASDRIQAHTKTVWRLLNENNTDTMELQVEVRPEFYSDEINKMLALKYGEVKMKTDGAFLIEV